MRGAMPCTTTATGTAATVTKLVKMASTLPGARHKDVRAIAGVHAHHTDDIGLYFGFSGATIPPLTRRTHLSPLRDQLHGQQALLQSRRAKWNESMEMPLPEVATTSKSISSATIAAVNSFLSSSDESPATGCSGASRAAERGGTATAGVGCTQRRYPSTEVVTGGHLRRAEPAQKGT